MTALLGLLLLAPAPPQPVVWFALGHRIVARLAEARLTPAARAAVADLLGGQSLADASAWADQVRGSRPATIPWHFVNIPLAARRYDPARDCGPRGCILSALAEFRATLADPTAPPPAREEAVRFVIHLVGDLAQPLHVSDHMDRGGNEVTVRLRGRTTNLHKAWDGELLEAAGVEEASYLARLQKEMAGMDLERLAAGGPEQWAMEGHRVAAEHAYDFPASGELGPAYVDENLPRIDRQLIAGGVWLARVLNEALADYHPATDPADPLPTGALSDREAAAHVGEHATVAGTVVTVHRSRGGNLFLNFGADYPRQRFTGAVLAPLGAWTAGLDTLAGRRVAITGTIRNYRGQVEIVVERPEQIEVLDPSP